MNESPPIWDIELQNMEYKDKHIYSFCKTPVLRFLRIENKPGSDIPRVRSQIVYLEKLFASQPEYVFGLLA